MERYAQKLRELKMKKARDMFGKAPVAKLSEEEQQEQNDITAATKALGM